MASFNDPSFQDRLALSKQSKLKALERFRAKPPVDEALMAERRQARVERETALEEERALKQHAFATAKAEKASIKAAEIAAAAAAAELKAARLKPATAAEMKAARDAKYAARKARK
jgi:hypothetical protein